MRYVFIVLLMVFSSANAEIYMWEDEKGLLHFGDEKPGNTEVKEIEVRTTGTPVSASKDASPDNSKISEYSIVHEDDSSLHLSIQYHYSGAYGENAWMSVKTANDGKSTRFFSYRPAKLSKGDNSGVVKVGIASAAPDQYCSSELVVNMYNRGGKFHEAVLPYEKCWTKKQIGQSQPALRGVNH